MIGKLRRDLADSLARLARMRREKRGVAAVEFALILPVLVTMYLGTIEVTRAVMANRKMVATTSTLGDLAAQAQVLGDTDVANLFEGGRATMQPFPTTSSPDQRDCPSPAPLRMRITQIRVLGGVARVAWSEACGGMSPLTVGSVFSSFPSNLMPSDPNTTQYFIYSEVRYLYTSPLGSLPLSFVSSMNMSNTFWLRPRIGECVRRNSTCG